MPAAGRAARTIGGKREVYRVDQAEQDYMGQIDAFAEEFGRVQREFIRSKSGVRALVGLIRDISGGLPQLGPDDPVLHKAREATEKALVELGVQTQRLERAEPPELWRPFHERLLESLRLQLDGYHEMSMALREYRIDFLQRGQARVLEGMSLLEAGQPPTG